MYTLGLDISSHTGWALFKDSELVSYGILNTSAKSREFPWGIYQWAKQCADKINELCSNYFFVDKIIIEKTNLGKNREFQSFLEWIHFFVLHTFSFGSLKNKINYIDTSQWKKQLNLKLTKEQREQNKFVLKQHKNGQKNVLQNDKRIGKVTSKHLSVEFVNKEFNLNLKLKNNDIADAVCIAFSHAK